MKKRFKAWRPDAESQAWTIKCNEVIQELAKYRLTLRQLYYQLVARNILPNKEESYKKLSRVLGRARLAGIIDWSAIEDRGRTPFHPPQFEDLGELVEAAVASYRLPRWRGQNAYVELWVEKDALASVLKPLAVQHHINLIVNKGYSSITAMHDASERFAAWEEYCDNLILLYLGDLDPSGEDMVRDITDRLAMFNVFPTVKKIALTIEQVEEYNPPPNPTKHSDPRSAEFIRKFGASSWEVDALHPSILEKLITENVEEWIEEDLMHAVLAEEEADKRKLRSFVTGI